MRNLIPLVIVILAIVGMVSCQVSLWRECRKDHSWIYCYTVLEHTNSESKSK